MGVAVGPVRMAVGARIAVGMRVAVRASVPVAVRVGLAVDVSVRLAVAMRGPVLVSMLGGGRFMGMLVFRMLRGMRTVNDLDIGGGDGVTLYTAGPQLPPG